MKARCDFNASEDVRALRPRERHDLPFRLKRSARFSAFCCSTRQLEQHFRQKM
ncbi:hypothetical protein HMPREF1583_01100 [Gardnerella vaginalis JCP8151B]|nr:hypothetical protein HMPREF1583_01100 [Gardnerella vaginalis JCP8151B]